MNYPATTRLSKRLMNSKSRFLGDGTGALRLAGGSLVLISALRDRHEREIGVSHSTVIRELKRNSPVIGRHDDYYTQAQKAQEATHPNYFSQ